MKNIEFFRKLGLTPWLKVVNYQARKSRCELQKGKKMNNKQKHNKIFYRKGQNRIIDILISRDKKSPEEAWYFFRRCQQEYDPIRDEPAEALLYFFGLSEEYLADFLEWPQNIKLSSKGDIGSHDRIHEISGKTDPKAVSNRDQNKTRLVQ